MFIGIGLFLLGAFLVIGYSLWKARDQAEPERSGDDGGVFLFEASGHSDSHAHGPHDSAGGDGGGAHHGGFDAGGHRGFDAGGGHH